MNGIIIKFGSVFLFFIHVFMLVFIIFIINNVVIIFSENL